MAITQTNWQTGALFDAGRTIFHQKADQLKAAYARSKAYRTTMNELSSLGDRELRDLGIARSEIKSLAMEATYGC